MLDNVLCIPWCLESGTVWCDDASKFSGGIMLADESPAPSAAAGGTEDGMQAAG